MMVRLTSTLSDLPGEGVRRTGRQEQVTPIAAGDLVQGIGAIDGLRPGHWSVESGEDGGKRFIIFGFRFLIFDSATADFGIEGFDADAEQAGFPFADAVVLRRRELGKARECLVIR